uniref:F-box domain-containing protein n=1 Tax=Lygus hesperus TaxID=30085 RepID=A0A146LFG1_LYGHE
MSIENHLGLPEEVFEIILRELDLQDVVACSRVCVGWRNAVNSNRIWEDLCKKHVPQERLQAQTKCRRMKASYEVHETDNFAPVCSWRQKYLNDVTLKRNWRNCWFQEDTIGDVIIPLHDFETDYEVLLEPSMARSSFTVYNIVDTPVMTDIIHFAMQQPIPEFFKLSNNVLVVVQCTLLQVYVKDENKNLQRKFVALFDRNHRHAKTIPDTPDLSNWYSTHVGLFPCDIYVRCDHNGKYFVGMYNPDTDFSSSLLHIWDLETFEKIEEVRFPRSRPRETILDITFSLHNNTLHIIMKLLIVDHGIPTNAMYSYDLDFGRYSGTVLRVQYVIPIILFTEKLACLTDLFGKKVFFFELADGRLLDTQETANSIDYRTLQVFDDLLTYAEFNHGSVHFTKVTVYDLKKFAVVDKFQVPNCKSIHSIHIVMKDLMIIGTSMLLLIRDLKNGGVFRSVQYFDFIPPDLSCTKMIAQKPEGELVVLHFW